MARAIMISLLIILLFAISANAQTGACCVKFECVGNMEEQDCHALGGVWYSGEDCDAGFECPMEFPCGSYVVGDFNGSGKFNVADIIEAFQCSSCPAIPSCFANALLAAVISGM